MRSIYDFRFYTQLRKRTGIRDLLLYGRDVFGLKLALSEQLGGDPSLEQQTLSGHLHQDETDQLPHVHTTDHLLKSTTQRQGKRKVGETHRNIFKTS